MSHTYFRNVRDWCKNILSFYTILKFSVLGGYIHYHLCFIVFLDYCISLLQCFIYLCICNKNDHRKDHDYLQTDIIVYKQMTWSFTNRYQDGLQKISWLFTNRYHDHLQTDIMIIYKQISCLFTNRYDCLQTDIILVYKQISWLFINRYHDCLQTDQQLWLYTGK